MHPVAEQLQTIMQRKQSNLALSADVVAKRCVSLAPLPTSRDLLYLADTLGPFICILKTHIDILSDFDQDIIAALQELSRRHNFLIFEDRKFADIGNTAMLQYQHGLYRIAEWAHITNAHSLSGEGIVSGLKQVGVSFGRGLLLVAQMSSTNSLFTEEYAKKTYDMAVRHDDFVFGFIAQKRLNDINDGFVYMTPGVKLSCTSDGFVNMTPGVKLSSTSDGFVNMTPGVKLSSTSDTLGQQYRTPRDAIIRDGCDVIIVGRGIYKVYQSATESEKKSESVRQAVIDKCSEYQKHGWDAYTERNSKI